ncbi:MAG: clan AA aspartic protease [Bacteroidetes bacterium]|nr:clan AA aspartic protease [Bacteroidota bacterium]
MRNIYTEIELSNPRLPLLAKMKVRSMVDTGALMLCIPDHVRVQLQLEEVEKREVTIANGQKQLVSYVGPIQVRFENRSCFVGALVLGDDVLLGAVPIEDMDLIVIPSARKITVNPQSPNFPHAMVK